MRAGADRGGDGARAKVGDAGCSFVAGPKWERSASTSAGDFHPDVAA